MPPSSGQYRSLNQDEDDFEQDGSRGDGSVEESPNESQDQSKEEQLPILPGSSDVISEKAHSKLSTVQEEDEDDDQQDDEESLLTKPKPKTLGKRAEHMLVGFARLLKRRWPIPIALVSLVLLVLITVSSPATRAISKLPGYTSTDYSPEYIAGLAKEGWSAFNVSRSSPFVPARRPQRPVRAQSVMSLDCTERWIAQGQLCSDINKKLPDTEVDIVWTWVAGSPFWLAWRDVLGKRRFTKALRWFGNAKRGLESKFLGKRSRMEYKVTTRQKKPGLMAKHFRSHHELQYSQRSVLAALPSVHRLHLLASDLPLCSPDTSGCDSGDPERVGEVPAWLDTSKIGAKKRFSLQHHYNLFKADDRYPDAWRQDSLPSFNSLAIESQLANVEEVSDSLLYLNDDMYILKPLSAADVSTPLFGSVFRIQKDLGVTGEAKGTSRLSPDGEWPSMTYSNWLLDTRFGGRSRSYLVHEAKTMSTPLLDEVASVWADELKETASIRFRGRGTEVNMLFLSTYYVIERHREALLWSFFIGRMDSTGSGRYSPADRRHLLKTINGNVDKEDSAEIIVTRPSRRFEPEEALSSAGLSLPKATKYEFSSADGYPLVSLEQDSRTWPKYDNTSSDYGRFPFEVCKIPIELCFGSDDFSSELYKGDVTSQWLFKNMAFQNPRCGDCVIVSLLSQSSTKGLDVFLPPKTRPASKTLEEEVPVMLGDLSKTWQDADYSLQGILKKGHYTAREYAVRLIQRYSYVIGDTPSRFVSVTALLTIKHTLDALYNEKDRETGTTFLVLNDDIVRESAVDLIDREIQTWHNKMWPDKTEFEL